MKDIEEQLSEYSLDNLLRVKYSLEVILFEKFQEEYPVGSWVKHALNVSGDYFVYGHFIDERTRELKLWCIRCRDKDTRKSLGTCDISIYDALKE